MDSAAQAFACPSLTSSYAGLSQRRPFFALYHYRECNFLSIAYTFSNLVSMMHRADTPPESLSLPDRKHAYNSKRQENTAVTYPL